MVSDSVSMFRSSKARSLPRSSDVCQSRPIIHPTAFHPRHAPRCTHNRARNSRNNLPLEIKPREIEASSRALTRAYRISRRDPLFNFARKTLSALITLARRWWSWKGIGRSFLPSFLIFVFHEQRKREREDGRDYSIAAYARRRSLFLRRRL